MTDELKEIREAIIVLADAIYDVHESFKTLEEGNFFKWADSSDCSSRYKSIVHRQIIEEIRKKQFDMTSVSEAMQKANGATHD